jgi:hypothetical protein
MEIIVATSAEGREHAAAPSDWQGWQRWVEEVDWPDWRSWLRRIAWTVWAAVRPAEAPWQRAPETGAVGLTVRAYEEDEAGDQVRARLAATWPAFHRWWREGRTIPLVIRYVLELCETAEEAVHVLRRVPVHMSYNVTALDRTGQ